MTDAFQYTIYNNGTIYSEYYPVTYILKNILNQPNNLIIFVCLFKNIQYSLYSFFLGVPGICLFESVGSLGIATQILGFMELDKSEIELKAAIAENGPISVGIYVGENFMGYSSGQLLICIHYI